MSYDMRAPAGPWDISVVDTNGMYSQSCLEDALNPAMDAASRCNCPAGQEGQSGTGAPCNDCEAGQFNVGGASCTECVAGMYVNTDADDCIACVISKYTVGNTGVSSVSDCIACDVGKSTREPGTSYNTSEEVDCRILHARN
jgi:hypothetical protein